LMICRVRGQTFRQASRRSIEAESRLRNWAECEAQCSLPHDVPMGRRRAGI